MRMRSAPSHEKEGAWLVMEPFMIHPNSSFAVGWNLVMTLSIIYTAVVVTFEVCFLLETIELYSEEYVMRPVKDRNLGLTVVSYIVDVIFIKSINFFMYATVRS